MFEVWLCLRDEQVEVQTVQYELLDVREGGEITQSSNVEDIRWWGKLGVETEPSDEWQQPHLAQLLKRYKPPMAPLFSIESESVVEMGYGRDVPGTTGHGARFESLYVELYMGDDRLKEFLWQATRVLTVTGDGCL